VIVKISVVDGFTHFSLPGYEKVVSGMLSVCLFV
jgi:hypothetical protein